MSRRFSKKQRDALEAVTGISQLGMEVDHKKPFSKGGETDVLNAQFLKPRENRMKSNKYIEPRKWQREFWEKLDNHGSNEFLLTACPGAGKTFAGLKFASEWRSSGPRRKVVVVVPTLNLRESWQADACGHGLQLQTKDFTGRISSEFSGAVATYAGVAANPHVFRLWCSAHNVLLICDEIHHCNDGEATGWGDALKLAFECSEFRLLLSGTPFRSDGKPIPFVNYHRVDGEMVCRADYAYDLPAALIDNVVRRVLFELPDGRFTLDIDGQSFSREVNENISIQDAKKSLKPLLSPEGGFVRAMLERAHERLMRIRGTTPDAGAMAACIDTAHAEKVAQVIADITGRRPAVITTHHIESKDTTAEISRFRESSEPWLVSVRQVSEGTDIKRLQVLAYLTNFCTDTFFRQVVGRVSRQRNADGMEVAHVFAPQDPRLKSIIQRMEEMQLIALREIEEKERIKRDPHERDSPRIEFKGSEIGEDHVHIISGQEVPSTIAPRVEYLMGEPFSVPLEQALLIARDEHGLLEIPKAAPIQPDSAKPLEIEKNDLRSKIKSRVGRLSALTGEPHGEIHKRYYGVYGKGQSELTLVQLKDKLERLSNEV